MFSITNMLLNRYDWSDDIHDMDAKQVVHAFSDFVNQKLDKIRESSVDGTLGTPEQGVFVPPLQSLVFNP